MAGPRPAMTVGSMSRYQRALRRVGGMGGIDEIQRVFAVRSGHQRRQGLFDETLLHRGIGSGRDAFWYLVKSIEGYGTGGPAITGKPRPGRRDCARSGDAVLRALHYLWRSS
jgi:hypothetical protein